MPSETATPVSNTANSGDTGADSDSSFIDGVLSAEGDSLDSELTERPEVDTGSTDDSPETTAPEAEAPVTETTAQEPDQALVTLAQELGLDPANARDRAALEKMIAKLTISDKQPTEKVSEPPEELTEFEKSLLAKPTETPATPETKPQMKTDAAPVQPRIDANWTSPDDAYKDLVEAYGDGEKPADFRKVAQIENAMFERRAQAVILPAVEEIFGRLLEKRFAGLMPRLQEEERKAQEAQDYDFAVAEISKTKGYEDFENLYKPVDDKRLAFRGMKNLPNSPINQVYMKYPHLLDIRTKHDDPIMAARLSNINRLRAVHKHWKEMSDTAKKAETTIPADRAKELVEAGAKQEAKKTADRTRQQLNGGPGASGSGAANKDSDRNWFDDMAKSAGGMSLADLLK